MSKILIVGPAWVGDMVMAQTLFKLMKQRHPETLIDVLAPGWSVPLLERMPEVRNALVMPIGHGQLQLKERFHLAKGLRFQEYDQAILLPNSFKSALIPFWANIPKRTGWLGEMRWGVLNDVRYLDKKRYPLMIERFMALGLSKDENLPEVYPIPELRIQSETQLQALNRHEMAYPTRPVLAICPGAEFGPAKRWPEAHYADIANVKLQQGWDVWIFGSVKDQPVAEEIMKRTNQKCINLSGRTHLSEAVDLLALAQVVVSNDSGLMHVAAALKKPLVALYGPTSPSFTPPLHDQAKTLQLKLDCQPCFQRECPLKHQRCMQELHPSQVLQAIEAMVSV